MPDRFYIWEDDERSGPFTERQIERMLEDELITYSHECENATTGKTVALDEMFEPFDEEEQPEEREEPENDEEEALEEDDEGGEEEWEYEEGEDEDDAEADDEEEWENDEEEDDDSPPPSAILYQGHPTWLRYIGGFVLVALGIAFGMWLGPRDLWFFVGGFGVSIVSLLAIIIGRSTRVYIVTPKRIELDWGLIARSSQEVRIEDIRTINVKKSGFTGILGVGTVEFSSTGDGVDVAFTDIWAAQKVKLLVRELQDEWE